MSTTSATESAAELATPDEARAEPTDDPVTVRAPQTVLRFDLHQRLQHGLMAVSFIVLVLTGWPLSTYGIGASRGLASWFGGVEGCALIHRIAALGLIASAVYHLFYLMVMLKRRRLSLAMFPTPRDVRDLIGNILFFVGLRPQRPRFGRYTYFEKFDYWAVFWGVFIMVGSGFIRWFPVQTTKWFPAWLYDVGHFAHADEGLLAALAIFMWHFYNVHLRPGVFPMSRVFLTGRLTMEELEHEHGAQYDQLMAERAGEPETADPQS